MAGSQPLEQLSLRALIREQRKAGVSVDQRPFNAGPLAVLELLPVVLCVGAKDGNDQRSIRRPDDLRRSELVWLR